MKKRMVFLPFLNDLVIRIFDLRTRRYQSAERSHGLSDSPSQICPFHLIFTTWHLTLDLPEDENSSLATMHLLTCCQGKQRGCVAAFWTSPWPHLGVETWLATASCGVLDRIFGLFCGWWSNACRLLACSAVLYGSNAVILQISFLHDLAMPELRGCNYQRGN